MRLVLMTSVLALAPAVALAQFSGTEVSASGSAEPFWLTRTGGGVFEDVGPGVVYNVYRCVPAAGRRCVPGDGFRCLDQDLPTPDWGGDAAEPVNQVWWYSVNAFNGEEENRHGNELAIVAPCHQPAPIVARKTARDPAVAPGGTTEFTLEIDNTLGRSALEGCTLVDDVGSSGCLRLLACGPVAPAIPGLVCDTSGSIVSASGFDVPVGTTQSLVLTVEAGSTPGRCANSFSVVCGQRQGQATAAIDIQAGCSPVGGTPPLRLELVASGLANPVHLAAPPGDRRRLFVVEKRGAIRVIRDGTLLAAAFLDIDPVVRTAGSNERGLLSLAFHPDYASNRRFFVYYTREPDGAIVVAEYQRSAASEDLADPAETVVLVCPHTEASNHNGGQVAFSPRDGYLYIGTGDGGNGCDEPNEDAESLGSCLGKILRLDVGGNPVPRPYAVPASNPFRLTPGALPEIWAYGLRNPWRFSFDRLTGDLYIGDVGQGQYEEVDVQPAASPGGEDYGWDLYEGSSCPASCPGEGTCDPAGKTFPVAEYVNPAAPNTPRTVVSGHVYRGCRLPGYHGTYFYADYYTHEIWSFVYDAATGSAGSPRDWTADFPEPGSVSSFGEDADGELYIVDHDAGEVYRIVPN